VNKVVLSGSNLSKSFGGVHAVRRVSLELGPDAPVTTIIGPNGAGKTTLLNLLCGAIPLDEGKVEFKGADITGVRMRQRMKMGIARTFQHTGIFGRLTPREHFFLMARNLGPGSKWHSIEQFLDIFNLETFADVQAESLNHVSQRLLEIGMIVSASPSVLMLDEPTAGMDLAETAQIASVIRELRGIMQVMIIEHDIDFVLDISDRIIVLDQGAVIASGLPDEIQRDDVVAAAYMRRGHR
jgi:ABC-type branched-subunit amino acid transport system ATPase component